MTSSTSRDIVRPATSSFSYPEVILKRNLFHKSAAVSLGCNYSSSNHQSFSTELTIPFSGINIVLSHEKRENPHAPSGICQQRTPESIDILDVDSVLENLDTYDIFVNVRFFNYFFLQSLCDSLSYIWNQRQW